MNVLSLFDGISCGQLALQRAGIKINNYYASEIDKYAIQITQKNFPNTIQLGDINNWQQWALPQIDLLIGGSPCQGFSFAGKGLNFEDPRSKLFFKYIDIRNHYKPTYFLLENVKMKKEYQYIINEYLDIEPIEINSVLVSAQNRKRLYWTNIPGIEQPKDKYVYLKDILEMNVSDKYILSDKSMSRIKRRNWSLPRVEPEKTDCILIKNNSGQLSIDSGTTLIRCVAMRGRNPENPTSRKSGLPTEQHLEPRNDGKTNCLTTVQKDNYLEMLSNGKFRRLTEKECERLQTLPDDYTNYVSSTQRYKCIGNGWTVDVIVHIFSYLKLIK